MKIIPLQEVYYSKLEINESKEVKDTGVLCTLKGPFAEIDNKNRNDRIYSKSLWEGVLNKEYVKEMLENKTLYGEANHPKDRFEISIPDVSHVTKNLYIGEDNILYGEADVLDTPAGRIVYTLAKYGSNIGISARAAGSLQETDEGWLVNEEDYNFFTFDFVPNPGFKSSRLNSTNEGKILEGVDLDKKGLSAIKEELDKIIETSNESSLTIIKSVLENSNKTLYKDFIDRVDNKLSKGSNSENTISVLEQAYRKIYDLEDKVKNLEKEKVEMNEKVTNLSQTPTGSLEGKDRVIGGLQEEVFDLEDKVTILEQDYVTVKKENTALKELINSRKSDITSTKTEPIVETREVVKEVEVQNPINEQLRNNLQETEKLKNQLAEENKNLKGNLGDFREYLKESIMDRTGATKRLVENLEPKELTLESINQFFSDVEESVRGSNRSSGFIKPVDVENSSVSEGKDSREDTGMLKSLIQKNKSK